MIKKELRKKYKELRKALTQNEIEELSIQIANNTLQIPIWDKSNYHLFLPIEKLYEINTEYVMHILQGRDKNIIISKSDFETNQMTHFLLTDNTKLKVNEFGIPEPENGLQVLEQNIEVVFVPLLAYDTKGNRVGYGKGFYDIFLKKCNPNTLKVGLSFFEAENTIDDVYEADIKLDFCITPNKIYDYK